MDASTQGRHKILSEGGGCGVRGVGRRGFGVEVQGAGFGVERLGCSAAIGFTSVTTSRQSKCTGAGEQLVCAREGLHLVPQSHPTRSSLM